MQAVEVSRGKGLVGARWLLYAADVYLTTGQSGTIVLDSKYRPMLPAFGTQQIGNALGWGIVDDTPNSFVWEIGHTSDLATCGCRKPMPPGDIRG